MSDKERKIAYQNGMTLSEEQQLYWDKEDYLEVDKAKEIERLNNIINELEKYINETKLEEFEKVYGKRYGKTFTQAEVIVCNMILAKLQELKGSGK